MKQLQIILAALLIVGTAVSCTTRDKEPERLEVEPERTPGVTERVPVALNMEALSNAKAGNVLSITFPEGDSTLVFTVRKVNDMVNGIRSISAVYKDMNTGLLNLVINEGKAAGKMVIYTKGMEYSVGYDTTSGSHFLQEITPEMKDRLEGSEPLIPGQDN